MRTTITVTTWDHQHQHHLHHPSTINTHRDAPY
jgi:hypothetical protein